MKNWMMPLSFFHSFIFSFFHFFILNLKAMYRLFQHITAIVACIALASCSSVYHLQIETIEPARVTLRLEGGDSRIMLVNNTVSQPDEIGFHSESKGGPAVPIHFPPYFVDTLIWGGVKAMGHILDNSHFFDAVYFYKQPVREDTQWMSAWALSENTVNQLLDESGCNVIISINRVLYLYKQEITFIPYDGTARVNVKSQATLHCSVHHYGQSDPVTSFTMTDSLKYYLVDVETDSTNLAPIPEVFLYHITTDLFEKAAHYFTPQWQVTKRAIYTGSNARMHEALAFAKKDKWEQAAEKWMTVYQNETKSISKARLSQNIAISFEVRDDISTAIQWMLKCVEYYQQFTAEPGEQTRAEDYLQALQQRVIDNKLLDIQLK